MRSLVTTTIPSSPRTRAQRGEHVAEHGLRQGLAGARAEHPAEALLGRVEGLDGEDCDGSHEAQLDSSAVVCIRTSKSAQTPGFSELRAGGRPRAP